MKRTAVCCVITMCVFLIAVNTYARHISKETVQELKAKCEAARQDQIAPLREQAIQECITKKTKSPEQCRRYYRDFGEAHWIGAGEYGHFQSGMFYDLPECQESFNAEKHLKLYPQ